MLRLSKTWDQINVLDPAHLPDDKLFTMFLDWAKSRRLISGYYLVIYHQTGSKQGEASHFDRIPQSTPQSVRSAVDNYINEYNNTDVIPSLDEEFISPNNYVYRTSISRSYDIDLGILIVISKYKIKNAEIDGFVRFMESTVSIRKQAIASSLNPPFIDMAMQANASLDKAVGETLVRAIEANETHVLHLEDGFYRTQYSTSSSKWTIDSGDPLVIALEKSSGIRHFQNLSLTSAARLSNGSESLLLKAAISTNCRSALIFLIRNGSEKYALAMCLFRRAHAVSMTETLIARNFQSVLSDYYRLGYERLRSAQASQEAGDVERRARQALLIADIIHDSTDDLIAIRDNLGGLKARNEIEARSLENAKRNLEKILQSAKLFKFLNTSGSGGVITPAMALTTGKNYLTNVSVRTMYESLVAKYRDTLDQAKITVDINTPQLLQINCMQVSVERAIDNCLKNSIRHLRGKTHITKIIELGAREILIDAEKFVDLWVYDNGPGIEEAIIAKVTRPFVSYSGGLGLGLAIASTVCDIHGGKLQPTSTWGHWTKIRLRFPQKAVGKKRG